MTLGGYDGTSSSSIPKDWKYLRVNQMGSVLAGKALNINGPGQLRPYLRTKNVLDGRIDLQDVLRMPMMDTEFERFRIIRNDVLLNEGQTLELVGRCSIYRDEFGAPCAMQNQLLRFRVNPQVSAEYSAHLFRHCQQTGKFSAIATQTTSVAHLGSSRFSNLVLPWPIKLSEQEAIAEALTDADKLINGLERMVAKKQAIKQGMMQQLLTDKTRQSHWPHSRLSELIHGLEAGVSVRSLEHASHGIAVLKTSAVDRGRFDPNEAKPVLPADVGRVRCNPVAGSLVISRMNTPALVGEVGYVEHDYTNLYLPDRLWLARPKRGGRRKVNMRWLGYYLSSDSGSRAVRELATGTSGSMKNIPKEKMSALEIPAPPVLEQDRIAEALSDADRVIHLLRTRLSKARDVKQGMQQQLLTARTRLSVKENVA